MNRTRSWQLPTDLRCWPLDCLFTGCGARRVTARDSPPQVGGHVAGHGRLRPTSARRHEPRPVSDELWRRAGSRCSTARRSSAGSTRKSGRLARRGRYDRGVSKARPGLLATTTQFADYMLHVEFLCPPGTNSGVFLATNLDPRDVSHRLLRAEHCRRGQSVSHGQSGESSGGQGGSESAAVADVRSARSKSGQIVVQLDGQQVLDYTDPQPLRRGHIGLQLNQGRVAFRNIRLRPLGLESIFNGQDLSGWKTLSRHAQQVHGHRRRTTERAEWQRPIGDRAAVRRLRAAAGVHQSRPGPEFGHLLSLRSGRKNERLRKPDPQRLSRTAIAISRWIAARAASFDASMRGASWPTI